MNKVLVVGQTPPPIHGQAMMIQRLLDGKYQNATLIHIRMAFSNELKDIGKVQVFKIIHLFPVIFKIFYHRIVNNAQVLYYPPSGANKIPIYRDMVILCLTRWMFKKTIFHFHASGICEIWAQLNALEKFFFQRAYFNCEVAIAPSSHVPPDSQFFKAKKCLTIPYGIEDNSLAATRTKDSLAPVKILFVGFLKETKGEFILLEACKQLVEKKIPFLVDFAGKFASEEIKIRFFNVVEQYQLNDYVNYIGQITGSLKNEIFANADIFCFPSYYENEAFPIVILEAMQFSLPIISTQWRGIPGMVEEGKNGYLVYIKDATAVAEKLQLLILDIELREKMGKESRKNYLEKFTMEKFYNNMDVCFSEQTN